MHSDPSPSPKIKVAVSSFTRAQLEIDMADYGLGTLGNLCNRIIAGHEAWPIPEKEFPHEERYKNSRPIQFNLYKQNFQFFNFVDSRHLRPATYCRYLFKKYTCLPRCRRELFVQRQWVEVLYCAIKNRAKVTLTYRDRQRECAPCFIAFSPSLARAYVVVYEAGREQNALDCFCALRIAHIRDVAVGKRDSAAVLSRYEIKCTMELYREHFDPYLSYGKIVKIRLTPEGERLLQNITTNRPLWNGEQKDGVYEFNCTETHAKHYFAQFLKEAEVLSPASLREWFAEQFRLAAATYTFRENP
ncbi:MAG: WYL domain-containing protein [Fibrobacteraceae bacterium]